MDLLMTRAEDYLDYWFQYVGEKHLPPELQEVGELSL